MEAKLSVVCTTYNHEKYIKQCLDGFISQITNFNFVVYVSDDFSTDETTEIIKEYAKKYPDVIKPIFRKKNIGSLNNFIETLSLVKSEYLAICEGDDYWINPNKLQMQVDFLDKNPEYAACFHPVKVVFENNEKKPELYPSIDLIEDKNRVTFDDMLKMNYIQTNSIVYRFAFIDKNIKDFFPNNIMPGDYYLHLLHLKNGDAAYLHEVMSVYRRHKGGIWWNSYKDIESLYLKYGVQMINFYYSVYEHLVTSKGEYYEKILLPDVLNIVRIFYKNHDFNSLEAVKQIDIQLFKKQDFCEKRIAKLEKSKNKYKKLFKITFLLFITVFIILIFTLI